jgi:4-cresol dehydrogenase (hydroxylating)
MMSVPDLGWGSIIGNALEHGYGYNVHGDHASALCGLEAVLADGTLLRTGQGAISNSPVWSPSTRLRSSLDELFKQSNFGVVTKAGLWLMPRPETIVTGTIRCEGDRDIVPMIDMLRRLMHEGVLQGVPMIVGTPADTENEEAGNGAFTMRNLRRVLRPAAGTRASASMAPPAWSKRGAPSGRSLRHPARRGAGTARYSGEPARTRWNRGT